MTNLSPSEAFWEDHYRAASPASSGRPSAVLAQFVPDRPPRRALDLGCARGDDAVWLARNGWRVTAVDVSQTALGYAARNAAAAGVADRVTFARHDLASSFPDGRFELVSAVFLQSPVDFPRARILRHAAAAVADDGLLVIATHGSRPPWSWADPDTRFPTADEVLADLDLHLPDWTRVCVGPSTRQATGPDGRTAAVTDILVILERKPDLSPARTAFSG